ncbi:MAG: class I SAM-dependent methyltransferase [Ruminococcaceae bacterium]|jgi:16S rRNA (guanine1207-N2)-methyltransferase|nr:class I SAM-dependent methyltransferase [Oscillospiraceae bacterium]
MSHYFDQEPSAGHQEKSITVALAGQTFSFTTDRAVFSRQRLDYGSSLLIETVLRDHPAKTGRLLDLGCGYGAVGIIMKRLRPALSVVLCDINERALALARRNALDNQARYIDIIHSDGLAAVSGCFDLILTNPPVRAGKKTVYRFFNESADRLLPGGALYLVLRKHQGAPSAIRYLETRFHSVAVIERSAGFWVVKATQNNG